MEEIVSLFILILRILLVTFFVVRFAEEIVFVKNGMINLRPALGRKYDMNPSILCLHDCWVRE